MSTLTSKKDLLGVNLLLQNIHAALSQSKMSQAAILFNI